MITFSCPKCGLVLEFGDGASGTVRCPKCRAEILVPGEESLTGVANVQERAQEEIHAPAGLAELNESTDVCSPQAGLLRSVPRIRPRFLQAVLVICGLVATYLFLGPISVTSTMIEPGKTTTETITRWGLFAYKFERVERSTSTWLEPGDPPSARRERIGGGQEVHESSAAFGASIAAVILVWALAIFSIGVISLRNTLKRHRLTRRAFADADEPDKDGAMPIGAAEETSAHITETEPQVFRRPMPDHTASASASPRSATVESTRFRLRGRPFLLVVAIGGGGSFLLLAVIAGVLWWSGLPQRFIGPPRNADPVTRALHQIKWGNDLERGTALRQLAKMVPDERRSEVARALDLFANAPDSSTRRDAVEALAVWGDEQNVPTLIQALNDDLAFTRLAAVGALARIKDERAIGPLADRIGVFPLEREVGTALQAFGPAAEKAVVRRLQSPGTQNGPIDGWSDRENVRQSACEILAVIGTTESIPALKAELAQKEFKTERAAAMAIRAIESRR